MRNLPTCRFQHWQSQWHTGGSWSAVAVAARGRRCHWRAAVFARRPIGHAGRRVRRSRVPFLIAVLVLVSGIIARKSRAGKAAILAAALFFLAVLVLLLVSLAQYSDKVGNDFGGWPSIAKMLPGESATPKGPTLIYETDPKRRCSRKTIINCGALSGSDSVPEKTGWRTSGC